VITLILGGARSGKSTYVEQLAAQHEGSVLYVATAQAWDEDMANRIATHRAQRPAHWRTLEAPVEVGKAILGAPPARFQEYEAQVRSEYAWVPDTTFRSGRANILKELLARPHLFCTMQFREQYEALARRNLRDSLAAIEGGVGESS